MDEEVPVSSFERGLAVLMRIADLGEASVEQVAFDLAMPLSTAYRFVKTLRRLDLVEARQGVYVPGWRLIELSGRHLTHSRLAKLGVSILQGVVEATSETAVLTVRSSVYAICLLQVASPHPDRYAFKTNQLLPLHAGAGQRVLLAHAPATVLHRVLERPYPRFTINTPNRARLLRDLERIRHDGCAVSRGELSPGALAMAYPVALEGEVICSLAVAGPAQRCDSRAWRQTARAALRQAAELLSRACEEITPNPWRARRGIALTPM